MLHIPDSYRRWIIARPMVDGVIRPDLFALQEVPMPALEEGEALVRVRLINLHSRTRLRLPTPEVSDGIGMARLGDTDLTNYACAEVVASRDAAFRVGDVVHAQVGWQEYQVIRSADGPIGYPPPSPMVRAVNGTRAPMNYVFRPEMIESWPDDVLMDVFGTSGMTAYFGMRECGPVMPRDRVLVAGASGGVGSIAAQLAKARGAFVVGLAGGEARCRWVVDTLDIDDCIDYRAPDLAARLGRAFPEGIDLFSDGVAGDLIDTVLPLMNRDGRLFAYGASAAFYARDRDAAPIVSLRQAFGVTERVEAIARARNIKIECWIVYDFYDERIAAENAMSRLLRQGRLKAVTQVREGFEAAGGEDPGAVRGGLGGFFRHSRERGNPAAFPACHREGEKRSGIPAFAGMTEWVNFRFIILSPCPQGDG